MIGDRWGVTDEEVRRHYPCDDLVTAPVLQAWRGVTVRASTREIWPWMGQIRLAPYSYDWIDNRGRRSPQELRGLADPRPGEPFTRSGGRPLGRIVDVQPGHQLTARIMDAVMSYVLIPTGDTSRLVLKMAVPRGRLRAPFLCVGDLVMARRQLLNLKALAERPIDHQTRP
ncbi:MAG TPA: hypothetical protein VGL26_03995 [Jatrophihabitans sp.]|jgi:hypothetical protein